MEKFSFEKLDQLFESEPLTRIGTKFVRRISEATKEYMDKYFFQVDNGSIYFWNAEKKDFDVHSKESIIHVYLNRIPDDLRNWFFKENRKIYKVVSEINNIRVNEQNRTLNTFFGFKHTYKPYKEHSPRARKAVDIFLSYMKEVLVSGDETCHQYNLNWTANLCQGKKNCSALYFQGPQGIGKSTFSTALMIWVLGEKITVMGLPDHLRGKFNRILLGKVLVVYEEMPTFSENEWAGVSSLLKKNITEPKAMYEAKHENSFQADNVNNTILNSNLEALKDSEGRRYMLEPITTKRREDHVYFKTIDDACYNDEFGSAFFALMLERDTSKFHAQNDMPITKNKLNAFAERLRMEYKFLKEEYLFQKKGIATEGKLLYADYKTFCEGKNFKPLTYIQFNSKLAEINILHKKSHGVCKYKVSYEELKALADKYHWIHELDEFKPDEEVQAFDDDFESIIKQQKEEIRLLKLEIASLKSAENVDVNDDELIVAPPVVQKKVTKVIVKGKTPKPPVVSESEEEEEHVKPNIAPKKPKSKFPNAKYLFNL